MAFNAATLLNSEPPDPAALDAKNALLLALSSYEDQLLGGGITGFAPPTAKVKLTLVSGSANTAMRSDASPPLDTTIAPTLTGAWTFSALLSANGGINVVGTAALQAVSATTGVFSGALSAANLSGTNTGDQSLSGYALLSGAAFTGAVSVGAALTVNGAVTQAQNSVSCPTGTATTATVLPSTYGVFLFTAWIAGQSTITSIAQIYVDPVPTTHATTVSGTGITISTSGLNVKVTQSLGSTVPVQWSLLRLA